MRRTSATGIRETGVRPRFSLFPGLGPDPGFTLIEVLVVIAVIGVIVAVAAPNLFPGNVEAARREGASVALAIERARDDAWFGGRPTAVSFAEGRMVAWRWTGDGWQNDRARDVALGSTRVTGLFVDGEQLHADDRVVFLPDGLGIPFRVALDVRGLPWAVEGDAAGAVTLVER
jgi:general secretion pathway protein H